MNLAEQISNIRLEKSELELELIKNDRMKFGEVERKFAQAVQEREFLQKSILANASTAKAREELEKLLRKNSELIDVNLKMMADRDVLKKITFESIGAVQPISPKTQYFASELEIVLKENEVLNRLANSAEATSSERQIAELSKENLALQQRLSELVQEKSKMAHEYESHKVRALISPKGERAAFESLRKKNLDLRRELEQKKSERKTLHVLLQRQGKTEEQISKIEALLEENEKLKEECEKILEERERLRALSQEQQREVAQRSAEQAHQVESMELQNNIILAELKRVVETRDELRRMLEVKQNDKLENNEVIKRELLNINEEEENVGSPYAAIIQENERLKESFKQLKKERDALLSKITEMKAPGETTETLKKELKTALRERSELVAPETQDKEVMLLELERIANSNEILKREFDRMREERDNLANIIESQKNSNMIRAQLETLVNRHEILYQEHLRIRQVNDRMREIVVDSSKPVDRNEQVNHLMIQNELLQAELHNMVEERDKLRKTLDTISSQQISSEELSKLIDRARKMREENNNNSVIFNNNNNESISSITPDQSQLLLRQNQELLSEYRRVSAECAKYKEQLFLKEKEKQALDISFGGDESPKTLETLNGILDKENKKLLGERDRLKELLTVTQEDGSRMINEFLEKFNQVKEENSRLQSEISTLQTRLQVFQQNPSKVGNEFVEILLEQNKRLQEEVHMCKLADADILNYKEEYESVKRLFELKQVECQTLQENDRERLAQIEKLLIENSKLRQERVETIKTKRGQHNKQAASQPDIQKIERENSCLNLQLAYGQLLKMLEEEKERNISLDKELSFQSVIKLELSKVRDLLELQKAQTKSWQNKYEQVAKELDSNAGQQKSQRVANLQNLAADLEASNNELSKIRGTLFEKDKLLFEQERKFNILQSKLNEIEHQLHYWKTEAARLEGAVNVYEGAAQGRGGYIGNKNLLTPGGHAMPMSPGVRPHPLSPRGFASQSPRPSAGPSPADPRGGMKIRALEEEKNILLNLNEELKSNLNERLRELELLKRQGNEERETIAKLKDEREKMNSYNTEIIQNQETLNHRYNELGVAFIELKSSKQREIETLIVQTQELQKQLK